MEFTGERAIEGKTREGVMRSHLARYEFAATYCRGKDVLDVACGTGYGSVILLENGQALSVLGIDISAGAIAYAQERYSPRGPSFQVGDILDLSQVNRLFDLIVCFETIEHTRAPKRALAELARLLRPDGLLIISTPNRILNSPGVPYWVEPCNEYHVREFSRREFQSLLSYEFEIVRLFGQCIFPYRGLARILAGWIRRNIEQWYLRPGCSEIRPLRIYEEAFYFVPICRIRRRTRPLWRRAAGRAKRALLALLRG